MNEDVDMAKEALRHWASGYLLKKSAGSELVKAPPLIEPLNSSNFGRGTMRVGVKSAGSRLDRCQ